MTDKHNKKDNSEKPNPSTIGIALSLSTELVSAVVVGLGIGYALDYWLGTTPWLIILFFILGSIAGVLNSIRAANKILSRTQENGSKDRE